MNTMPEPNLNPHKPKSRAWLFVFPILALLVLTLILVLNETPLIEPKEVVIPTDIPKANGPLEVLLYNHLPDLVSERFTSDWRLVDIHFNEDSTQAVLWMAETDPEGEVYEREPMLILALLNSTHTKWTLHVAQDEDFGELLLSSDFGDTELADSIFVGVEPKAPTGMVYGGYYLPWRGDKPNGLPGLSAIPPARLKIIAIMLLTLLMGQCLMSSLLKAVMFIIGVIPVQTITKPA